EFHVTGVQTCALPIFIRGTPLLVQLFIIYYGLPQLGVQISAYTAAVLGLGINGGAYMAESYRASIEAIPRGQTEAALSLGMTPRSAERRGGSERKVGR